MKKLILLALFVIFSAGCAGKTVSPVAPSVVDLRAPFRKQVEVTVIDCQRSSGHSYRHREQEYRTLVESTQTGERFYLWGCYGSRGERFMVTY